MKLKPAAVYPILHTSLIILLFLFYSNNLTSQNCSIIVESYTSPSSCYATDGTLSVSATDPQGSSCDRTIIVFDGSNQLVGENDGQISLEGLASGIYSIIAEAECGCQIQTKAIFLDAGEPTPLISFVNVGVGFYQSNKVFVCAGTDVQIGTNELGLEGFTIEATNGFFSTTPDASSYWNFNAVSNENSGIYTISFTNEYGCISTTSIELIVSNLNVSLGDDQGSCLGEEHILTPSVSGESSCPAPCESTESELIVNWTLDQCNAQGQNNQNSYSEFIPEYPNASSCINISATNVYRDLGEHSCTFVGNDGIGMCTPAMPSCNPDDYNEANAIKFEVTINPSEIGGITKLSFFEQSPLVWTTTNGSSGTNNYNTKYLIKVYKDNNLIYSQNDINTELVWNEEVFDFGGNTDFMSTETATFRFELRGYCTVNNGGNMSGWELDDIKIFGGCCSLNTEDNILSYLWSDGSTAPELTVNPEETTTYSVTVTDCSGCEAYDSITITKFPLPDLTISGNFEICNEQTTVLTANGGDTYLWSTGETSQSIEVSPASDTSYSVTATSSEGCISDKTQEIIVNPLPNVSIWGDFEICNGESITLTAIEGESYIWSTGQTGATIQVSPTSTTTYSVTATSDKGCMASSSEEIVVNPLPDVSITGIFEICDGETTLLTANGGDTYEWNTGETSASIEVSPTETTEYSVIVTSDKGCISSKSQEVAVNPLPNVSIWGDFEICAGESTTLTAIEGETYVWSTGESGAIIEVNPSSTTTYSVTATSDKGCIASSSEEIVVNPLPDVIITGIFEICDGETTVLTANGGDTYEWNTGETSASIEVSPTETTEYSVIVTSDKGCISSKNQEVTVNPLPDVLITGIFEICDGETTVLTANGGDAYEWNTGETSASIEVSPTETTEYSVIVTSNKGCLSSKSQEVVINPLPNVSIWGDFEICEGESTTLTAIEGETYVWSTGESGAIIEVNPSSTTTYSVTATSDKGCIASSSEVITVNPNPEISIWGIFEICEGQSTSLTVIGADSYEWSTGETTSSIDVNPATTTTYSVTGFTDEGCLAFVSQEINVTPIPLAEITGESEVCMGGTVELTASGGSSYEWSTGETSATITVTPSNTTIYSVTVSNGPSCESIAEQEVVVNENPNAEISGEGEICISEKIILTASGGSSYEWSTGETSASIEVSPTETTEYSVKATNEAGCKSTVNHTVEVNALPEVTIDGNTSICLGESTELSAVGNGDLVWNTGETTHTIVVSPTNFINYSVTITNQFGCQDEANIDVSVFDTPTINITGETSLCQGESTILSISESGSYLWSTGETTQSITVNPMENTTYSATLTSSNGCTNQSNIDVEINPNPSVTVTGNPNICLGEICTLTASGGNTYLWSNGESTSIISVSPLASTTYIVTVTNEFGCMNTESQQVNVYEIPNVNITGDSEICNGNSANLLASGGSEYEWNTGQTTAEITVSPINTTTYTITTTNPFGCTNTDQFTVNVLDSPEVIILGDTNICKGSSTVLSASGGESYLWNTGQEGNEITVNPNITSTYSVSVTSSDNCVSEESVTVIVNDNPEASISGPGLACHGDEVTLVASGGNSYNWSNGATTNILTLTAFFNAVYKVTISDNNGCTDVATHYLLIDTTPEAEIIGDSEICEGGITTLTASGGENYIWNTGEDTSTITVSPGESTTYTVTVTNNSGCEGSADFIVRVLDSPEISIAGETSICDGSSTTLTCIGGVSFQWNTGQTTKFINVSPSATTTYSVIAFDSNGCQAEATITVVVNDKPTAMIEGPENACKGSEVTLIASGGQSYKWSNGATTDVLTLTAHFNAVYKVTVTDENGCTDVATHYLLIKEEPTGYIEGDSEICKGDKATLVITGNSLNECENTCSVEESVTLAYWSLESCYSNKFDSTNFDYTELLPITDTGSCLGVNASNVYRNIGPHSCTPHGDSIGMCISSQDYCNPTKLDYTQALKFEVALNPENGGRITGLEFYEQSPDTYNWIDGPEGGNNYATKFLIRISKNGEIIYYQTDIATNRDWTKMYFDFATDPNFVTNKPAIYLFEMIPYCRIDNEEFESVWDIDEIKVLGNCCDGTQNEVSSYEWSDGSTSTSIMVMPTETTLYSATITDCCGCTSVQEFEVLVNCITIDLGDDKVINLGETVTLSVDIEGESRCEETCEPLDVLLATFDLDDCNADDIPEQTSYVEFVPTFNDESECIDLQISNLSRTGLHSCTGGITEESTAMCFLADASCEFDSLSVDKALKFDVTIDPNARGQLSRLTFFEKSPLLWSTTNGNTGINNYNSKYALRIFKGEDLVYASYDNETGRNWNLESHDFTGIAAFTVSEISTFSFELYGYCVQDLGGSSSSWDIDNISIYGGCCNEESITAVNYLWSTGQTTATIDVSPSETTSYSVTVTDCNECESTADVEVVVVENKTIVIFPNPASKVLEIKYFNEFYNEPIVRLFNNQGQFIMQLQAEQLGKDRLRANLPNHLINGSYMLEVEIDDSKFRRMFIKID